MNIILIKVHPSNIERDAKKLASLLPEYDTSFDGWRKENFLEYGWIKIVKSDNIKDYSKYITFYYANRTKDFLINHNECGPQKCIFFDSVDDYIDSNIFGL
jgi:hypothetical protein